MADDDNSNPPTEPVRVTEAQRRQVERHLLAISERGCHIMNVLDALIALHCDESRPLDRQTDSLDRPSTVSRLLVDAARDAAGDLLQFESDLADLLDVRPSFPDFPCEGDKWHIVLEGPKVEETVEA